MTEINGVLLLLVIVVPAAFSFFALIKSIKKALSLGFALFTLYLSLKIFLIARLRPISFEIMHLDSLSFTLYADNLSGFIVLGCSLFATLLVFYSPIALNGFAGSRFYLFYVLLTLASANGVALSHNFFLLIFFWGFLVATLYAMMMISHKNPVAAAQKAFLIIGVSDIFLLLGFLILFIKFGVTTITLDNPLSLDHRLLILTYILILIGVLAKAGAMPLHSWIPEAAKVAPASTMAFIPASLDKLLGIYLLIRVSYFIFDLHSSLPLRMLLMVIGSITIVAAVMMAMIQKEALKLLSFHAVSQVGYMVLGIGTGLPIGIAGGLFHMINHAIYKSCLFLSAGSVEYRARTTELEYLGGLGTKMPFTLFSFIVAAFAISGVPPFNGFYSKWMVYQGVVELSRQTNFWPIFLIAAMFGSVLTLASFLKIIHSIFLGSRPKELEKVTETNYTMITPTVILALLCIVFGIFATQIPLKYLIYPSLPFSVEKTGFWSPTIATILIIVALIIGLVIFLLGTALKPRKSPVFIGGEVFEEEARIPGTEFYSSIKYINYLQHLYEKGETGAYDLYNLLLRFTNGMALIVFRYLDRVIDQANYIVVELTRFFSSTLRSLVVWYIILLFIPLLGYIATGSLIKLQILALMLLIGGPLMALTENHLNKFLLTVTGGQLGFILLSFSSGHAGGVGLFQLINSIIALEIVYIGIRTAINLTGKTQMEEIHGLVNNAGVVSVGFIMGGLMLSALPPFINFFSKFMTTSLFEDNNIIIYLVGLGTFLNLAAFLRISRKVFLGRATFKLKKKFGSEELLIVVLLLINIMLTLQSGRFIELFWVWL